MKRSIALAVLLALPGFAQEVTPGDVPALLEVPPAPEDRPAAEETRATGPRVAGESIIDVASGESHGDISFADSYWGISLASKPSWPGIRATLPDAATTTSFSIFNNSARLFILRGDGRAGIGTSTPSAKLHVVASDAGVALTGTISTLIEANTEQHDQGASLTAYQNPAAGVTNTGSISGARLRGYLLGPGNVTTTYGALIDSGVYPDATGTVTNAYGVRIFIPDGGGSITKGYGLYVDDVQATKGLSIYAAGADDTAYIAGNVGIGTSSPATRLHIVGKTHQYFRLEATDPDQLVAIQLKNDARQWQLYVDGWDNDKFHIRDNTTLVNRMTFDASGRVGINNTTPGSTLHVNGDATVSTTLTVGGYASFAGDAHFGGTVTGYNIKAKYQDVAEWVPATHDLTPGTVVVLNPERDNEVMPSSSSYDTTVAGVVSAQPGISLGEEAEGSEQIATTGRVKVRVDATRAPIRIGDLLVTSEVPGTAMRSEPLELQGRRIHQPGTIIGKALQPLADGVGEILVLLSMQ